MIDFSDKPFISFPDQQKVPRIILSLLLNNGISRKITLHKRHPQPIGRANELTCILMFPEKELAIFPKMIPDILPPQLALPLKARLHTLIADIIPQILQLIKINIPN